MNENEKANILAGLSFDIEDDKEAAEPGICPWIDKIVFKTLPSGKDKGRSISAVHQRTRLPMKHRIEHKNSSDFWGKEVSLSKFSQFMPSNCRKVKTNINSFQRHNKNNPRAKLHVENNLTRKFKNTSACVTSILPRTQPTDCSKRYRKLSTGRKYSIDYSLANKLFPAQNDPSIWQMLG